MDLKHPSKLDQGGNVAELSRPARDLRAKFKKERRKPQGRKALHTKVQAKRPNWVTPFLFQQIENARITAGGPKWSTRAIERELKKKDPVTFKNFSQTTIDSWINRSGDVPKWSEKTLARVKRGNDTANHNGGQKGVLVSFYCYEVMNNTDCLPVKLP
jgi:hypothetical protein